MTHDEIGELYANQRKRLVSHAKRIVGREPYCANDYEDVVQDVFVRQLAHSREAENPPAYLNRAVRLESMKARQRFKKVYSLERARQQFSEMNIEDMERRMQLLRALPMLFSMERRAIDAYLAGVRTRTEMGNRMTCNYHRGVCRLRAIFRERGWMA